MFHSPASLAIPVPPDSKTLKLRWFSSQQAAITFVFAVVVGLQVLKRGGSKEKRQLRHLDESESTGAVQNSYWEILWGLKLLALWDPPSLKESTMGGVRDCLL